MFAVVFVWELYGVAVLDTRPTPRPVIAPPSGGVQGGGIINTAENEISFKY